MMLDASDDDVAPEKSCAGPPILVADSKSRRHWLNHRISRSQKGMELILSDKMLNSTITIRLFFRSLF
jgi:hypothetical protein